MLISSLLDYKSIFYNVKVSSDKIAVSFLLLAVGLRKAKN